MRGSQLTERRGYRRMAEFKESLVVNPTLSSIILYESCKEKIKNVPVIQYEPQIVPSK